MVGPKNSTTSKGGSRFYTWRGENFFSVTTIIGGGLAKPVLVNWAKKYTAEYAVEHLTTLNQLVADDRDGAIDWLKGAAYRERDRAGDIGTYVHAATEAYVLGQPFPEAPAVAKPRIAAFHSFLAAYEPEYELTESSVYSRAERYAGTLDAIVTINGRKLLIDMKTGAKGPYPEVSLQLAAYRFAEFIGMPDGSEVPMPAVDGCAVLKLVDDGYEFYEVLADENIHRHFLYVRECFRFLRDVAPNVIVPYNDWELAAKKAAV